MTKPYIEDDIAAALFAIAGGMSMRKACSEYGIPYITLYNCINNHLLYKKGVQNLQKIVPVQERALANQILVQETLKTNPTHHQIQELGKSILNLKGGNLSLNKQQIYSFLERNLEIKTKRQYKIDNTHINNTITEIINKFFEKLDLSVIKHIKPENRWNMNETNIIKGQDLNGIVFGNSKRCFIQKKQSGLRTQTSFIECILVTKRVLLPLVIFKGKTFQ